MQRLFWVKHQTVALERRQPMAAHHSHKVGIVASHLSCSSKSHYNNKGEKLLFLFPSNSPAICVSVELADFDEASESVEMYFNNLANADAGQQRRRQESDAGGLVLLVKETQETEAGACDVACIGVVFRDSRFVLRNDCRLHTIRIGAEWRDNV
jgi:hypothetical protein